MNIRIKIFFAVALTSMLGITSIPSTASAGSLKDKLDNIQISGFVDASVSGTDKNNANGTRNKGFGLDQVELDVEYNKNNVGLRFDLNVFPSDTTAVTNDSLMEQGYMTYTIQGLLDEGLTFTFGKFNAPIGWELLDAPDMYQFSHALVFNYGLPTNLTGVMASGKYNIIDVSAYWTNGTDVNGVQQNGLKTFGGRIGIIPFEGLNIGVSYLQDKNHNNNVTIGNPSATITDIDFTYEGIENLIIGAEYNENKGFQNDATVAFVAPSIRSKGYMVMGHYNLTNTFGVTVRYDYFDFDRALTGESTAFTGAITAALGDGLGVLLEIRNDRNTATAADPVGTPANSNVRTYAFEATYGF